jgi:hypothetical protein
MKIIDAFWEKRNLGVETAEFVIECGDNDHDTIQLVVENEKEYNVVKIPTNKPCAIKKIQDAGYNFIECSYNLINKISDPTIESFYARFTEEIRYSAMNAQDIEKLYYEINAGMFSTDRIYRDISFKKEQAAGRYINWIKDELKKGNEVQKLEFDGKIFGFFLVKQEENKTLIALLAGLYSDYKDSLLGINCMYQPLNFARQKEIKVVKTNVSSNNPASLTTHLAVGYKINSTNYVFVKHNIKYNKIEGN